MAITDNRTSVDASLVPYIRSKQVEFATRNLKPFALARIFFDDIAVNSYVQAANRIIIDSKLVVTLSQNNTQTIYANDIVYQGSSNTDNTFNGIVDSVSGNTIIIRRSSRQDKSIGGNGLTGNFDDTLEILVENVTSGSTYTKGNVITVSSQNTADAFYAGEGVLCKQAGNHYATIISTSGDNIIYVNQNYINLNVGGLGNAISAMTNDFKAGDIVYQTADGSKRYDKAVFIGEVAYYNKEGGGSTRGVLAVKHVTGRLVANSVGVDFANNVATNARSYIWNNSNTSAKPLFAGDYNKDTFGSTGGRTIQSITNSSANVLVNSYFPRSSIIANTDAGPNNQCINMHVSATIGRAVVGNLVYFVSGTGVGEIRRCTGFVSANPEIIVLNSAPSFTMTGNTYFSIENMYIDSYGGQGGIFHIPEYPNLKFKTGNRVLSVTDTNTFDNPDYGMRAAATYSATGVFKTGTETQTTPILNVLPEVNSDAPVKPISPSERTFNNDATKSPLTDKAGGSVPRLPIGDSLAQTFFTPKPASNKQDYGMFVSSIDLFFKTKPSYANGGMLLPVTVKIAEVVNGFPTQTYLGTSTVQFDKIKVSTTPSSSNTNTITKFTFPDPVYLQPSREYAIIVNSDSPDYEVFVAEMGSLVLGATQPRRISDQPYAGAFFRAQNSSTWAPYNNIDLMFVINKAVFNTSGSAVFRLADTPTSNVEVDRVTLLSTDLKFPKASLSYSVKGMYAYNATQDAGVAVEPNSTLDYGALLDRSASTGSVSFLNRRRIYSGNANSYQLTVNMSTTDTDISPVINLERLGLSAVRYKINNGGLPNTVISITSKGVGYNAAVTSGNAIVGGSNNSINNFAQLYRETFYANNFNIGFYNIAISGGGGSGATGFAVANTDGTNTVNYIVITTSGSGYVETPALTIANGNATTNTTATALVSGETGKSGGNIYAKYISREIILEDGFEAGDLRVFTDAIRPSPTDIQVYYKVLSPDDPEKLSDKSWRRMEKYKDIYSRNATTNVTLEFRPSLSENRISYTENGRTYPIGGRYKRFAVKVCLLTPDPALVPKIDNLRIIAVPEG